VSGGGIGNGLASAVEFLAMTAPLVFVELQSKVGEITDDASSFLEVGFDFPAHNSSLHIFHVTDPQQWSIRSDPMILDGPCKLIYTVLYVAGWLSTGMLWGAVMDHERDFSDDTSRGARFTRYFAVVTIASNLVYAIVVSVCATSASTCNAKSRIVINYIWPGFAMIVMGGLNSYMPQKEDQKLERYLVARQHHVDEMLQRNAEYDTSSAYDQHRNRMALMKDVENLAKEMKDHTGVVNSVSLRPIKFVAGDFSEFLSGGGLMVAGGVLWIFVVVTLSVLVCTRLQNEKVV